MRRARLSSPDRARRHGGPEMWLSSTWLSGSGTRPENHGGPSREGSGQMGRLVYELRVRGPVPAEVLEELGAEDFGEEPPLTILRTEPTDQPGLAGLLQRLRSLGLDLMEVRTAGPDPADVEAP